MLTLTRERVNDVLRALDGEFAGELSSRIVAMVESCADPARVKWPSRRRADLLWLPDLETRPWYEREEFPWVADLEAAAEEIAAECLAVTRHLESLELYLGDAADAKASAPGPDGLAPPDLGWKAFFLRRTGIWRRENTKLCPVTTSIVKHLPLSAGDVMFSVLAPRTKIVPHFGLNNLDLTCHLGIDVPPDCGIEVGGETRTWTRGQALVFDDTYRHWAWNRSDSPRRVLLFDFWNPRLTGEERTQLKRALPLVFSP